MAIWPRPSVSLVRVLNSVLFSSASLVPAYVKIGIFHAAASLPTSITELEQAKRIRQLVISILANPKVMLWAAMWENVPPDICAQRRHKSACASDQSDQSLRCPHEETLHPWLSKTCPVKILIRLRECAVWSESSLSVYARRYMECLWRSCRYIWRFGSYVYDVSALMSMTFRLLCPVGGQQFITKTCLFKYTENFTTKKWTFSDEKKIWYFHISAQNIDCGYSLEPPRRGGSNEYPRSMFWAERRGGSNEYPQSMFWAEIRKLMYTPVNPSFTILTWV